MLTQERTFVDIEKEIAKRIETDIKDSQLPVPPPDDRKGVGGRKNESGSHRSPMANQTQHLKPIQLNQCSPIKAPREPSTISNGSLNFSTSSEDMDNAFLKKPKTIRDPMSHRIIEKRRRDRMNNCLADLSGLIPTNYLKQGQGRIEKTEIIELAIKHIKYLTNCITQPTGRDLLKSSLPDRYLGFKECQDEVMRYLVEVEGWDAMDKLCARLMSHLEQAGEKFRIMNDESLSKFAKEEQYRHADEEMGTSHKHKKARMMKPRPVAPDDGSYPPQEQVPMYVAPSQVPQEVVNGPATAPQEPTPMDIQAVFQSFNNFESAQQVTRDHLKRDKHLWTLLQSQYQSTTVDDSGVSTDPGSNSSNVAEDKLSEEQAATNNSKSFNETGSANSSSCGTADSSSEKNGSSVYKFKHNITQRFSLEEKKVNPSDTSSSSSNEDKRAEKGKRKFRHVRSSHFRPTTEAMETANNSNGESGSNSSNEDVKLSNYLAAFVLHPVGTHYVPLSIHPSSIKSDVFAKNGQNVYHPISIPVNFGGPLLYMERVVINSDSCTSFGSSTTNSPIGCSGENSSTCNSDNIPSPAEPDTFKSQS